MSSSRVQLDDIELLSEQELMVDFMSLMAGMCGAFGSELADEALHFQLRVLRYLVSIGRMQAAQAQLVLDLAYAPVPEEGGENGAN